MISPMWTWSVARIVKEVRSRRVSVRSVLEASLERVAQVNPSLNAIIDVYAQESRKSADRLDSLLHAGVGFGSLTGVPTAIKDNTRSKGHPAADGIPLHANELSDVDDPVVQQLRNAGAIIMGRTNCPPHCWQLFCTNELYGTTTNARDRRFTPGGSSGGAGSAIAAGMVRVGQGNDIAGSLRYPAYANGIVGLRPTVGLIPGNDPTLAHRSLQSLLFVVQGPMGATVEDVRLAFDAMKGYAPQCAMSVPPVSMSAGRRSVGVYRGGEISSVQSPVSEAIDVAIRKLEQAGYEVRDISTDVFQEAFRLELQLVFQDFLQSGSLQISEGGPILAKGLEGCRLVIADMFGDGYKLTLADLQQGYARRGVLIARLQQLLEEYPVILMPSSSQLPYWQNEDQYANASRKKDMVYAVWPQFSIPILGFPALAVPSEVMSGNIHVGVQLVSRRFAERDLFDAGAVIE